MYKTGRIETMIISMILLRTVKGKMSCLITTHGAVDLYFTTPFVSITIGIFPSGVNEKYSKCP